MGLSIFHIPEQAETVVNIVKNYPDWLGKWWWDHH